MIRRHPRSTRTDTLFPYTTLFRSQRTRRQADERQLRADLEPRFGHHFEDEGRLSDFTSLVGAGPLPLPPRLRRHPKAARFLGSGRFLFWCCQLANKRLKSATGPLALRPRLAIFLPMMFPVSTIRSEARSVGKEWVSTCRSRWSPSP